MLILIIIYRNNFCMMKDISQNNYVFFPFYATSKDCPIEKKHIEVSQCANTTATKHVHDIY